MNDHLATIIHNDKTAQWRREAFDARLLVDSATGDDEDAGQTRSITLRRVAVVVAVGLLMLYVLVQYGAAV